jgi:hypothetical protein
MEQKFRESGTEYDSNWNRSRAKKEIKSTKGK